MGTMGSRCNWGQGILGMHKFVFKTVFYVVN